MPREIFDMLKLFPTWRAYGKTYFHAHPDKPLSNPIWRPGMPAPAPPPRSGAPISVVGFRAEMRVAHPGITLKQIETVRRTQDRATSRKRVIRENEFETSRILRSAPDCICGKCDLHPSKRRRWNGGSERHCPHIPSPSDLQHEALLAARREARDTANEEAERRKTDIVEQLMSLHHMTRSAPYYPLATRRAIHRTHPARKRELQEQLRAVSAVLSPLQEPLGAQECAGDDSDDSSIFMGDQPGHPECLLSLPAQTVNPDPVPPKKRQNWNYKILSFIGMAAAHSACHRAAALIGSFQRGLPAPGWRCHRCDALDPGALLALQLRRCGVHPSCGCGSLRLRHRGVHPGGSDCGPLPAACAFDFRTNECLNECDECLYRAWDSD